MNPLGLPLFFFFLFTFVFGSLVFFVEPCYNHETCKFPDIYVSCYFAMVTMTTVGYGDIAPTMFFSRAVTTIIMLFGALFLSMPVAIVGSEFDAAWAKLEKDEGKDDETIKQELHEFEMRKKRLGVNLITRLHRLNNSTKFTKEKTMNLIEKVTSKVLNQESQNESAEMITDSRFYIYDVYLKISDHINAIYDLIDESTVTLERLEWCLDVMTSCNSLMKKILSISSMAGTNDGPLNLTSKIRDTEAKMKKGAFHPNGDPASPNINNNSRSTTRGTGRKGTGRGARSNRRASTRNFATSLEERSSSRGSENSPAVSLGRMVTGGLGNVAGGLGNVGMNIGGGLGLSAEKLAILQKTANAHQGTFASVANVLGKGVDVGADMISGVNEEEKHFVKYICDAMYKNTWRDRTWLLLEVPQSGPMATRISNFMITVIMGSIALFVFESVPAFTTYGEGTAACENIVKMYCEEPANSDATLNPGCFKYANNITEDAVPLRFSCTEDDCFGVDQNFGYGYKTGGIQQSWNGSYLTCDGYKDDDVAIEGRPFADQSQLPEVNDFTWLHTNMNAMHDICFRPECNNKHELFFDFSIMYFPFEAFFALVFSVEVLMRAVVSRSLTRFWLDPMNILDVASILPFYLEILISMSAGTPLDFTISGADSAGLMLLKILKVTRVFKMTRHFSGTMVLNDTFKRSMSKL